MSVPPSSSSKPSPPVGKSMPQVIAAVLTAQRVDGVRPQVAALGASATACRICRRRSRGTPAGRISDAEDRRARILADRRGSRPPAPRSRGWCRERCAADSGASPWRVVTRAFSTSRRKVGGRAPDQLEEVIRQVADAASSPGAQPASWPRRPLRKATDSAEVFTGAIISGCTWANSMGSLRSSPSGHVWRK